VQVGGPEGFAAQDEVLLFDGEGFSVSQAAEAPPPHEADGDHAVDQVGREGHADGQGEDDGRDGAEDIGDPH